MPTNVKVKDLKINTLTEAQYDAAVQSGVIGENEISVLTDAEITAKDVHAVPQYSEMPEATSLNVDEIAQYIGTTIPDVPASAIATQTVGSGLSDLSVNVDTFIEAEQPSGDETVSFVANVVQGHYEDLSSEYPHDFTVSFDIAKYQQHCAESSYLTDWCLIQNTNGLEDGYWEVGRGFDNIFATNLTLSDLETTWGIMITNIGGSGTIALFRWENSQVTWSKNDMTVYIADYGISYSGIPANGDTISVAYTPFVAGITNGYFYKSSVKYSDPTATISQTVGSGLSDLLVNVDTFIETEQPTQDETVSFVANEVPESLSPTVFMLGEATITVDVSVFLPVAKTSAYSGDWNNVAKVILSYNGIDWAVDVYDRYNNNLGSAGGINIEIWGVSVDGTLVSTGFDQFVMNYSIAGFIWSKNGTTVDLAEYGISYSGTPVDGDTLTVVYTAPVLIGYTWEQTDVQPSSGGSGSGSGIKWKTKVDLPVEYSGDPWQARPYYTITGGLPDGTYEFYFSTKETTESNGPLGEVIFKVLMTIDNTNTTFNGKMGYVFDGNYMNDGNTVFGDNSKYMYGLVFKNGNDTILFCSDYPWASDVFGYITPRLIPECFKLSAIKNVDTGDEYVATGAINLDGSWPEYTTNYSGSVKLTQLVNPPYVPAATTWTTLVAAEFATKTVYINKRIMGGSLHLVIDGSELIINFDGVGGNEITPYSQEIVRATGIFAGCYLAYNTSYIYVMGVDTTAAAALSGIVRCACGGSSQENISIWFDTIPTESLTLLAQFGPQAYRLGTIIADGIGNIVQYTGATDANYTNGYYYKANGTLVSIPASIMFTDFSPSDVTVTVANPDALITAMNNLGGWGEQWVRDALSQNWTNFNIDYDFSTDTVTRVFWSNYGDMSQQDVLDCFAVSTTGSYSGSLNISFVCNHGYTPAHYDVINTSWDRIDTQPSSSIQVITLPEASASEVGKIYEYIGTTDINYTHGYFYECNPSLGFVGPAEDATEGEPGESMVFALDADAFAAYLQTKSIALTGQTTFYLEEGTDSETGDNIYILQDVDTVTIEEFLSLADMESSTGITWGGQEDLTGDFPYSSENTTGFVVDLVYNWKQLNVQPNSGKTQYDTMPEASAQNENEIVQYIGVTNSTYTNGYFYKCSGSAERSATASQTSGSGLTNINVDIDTFETQISVSGSYDFMYDDWEGTWTFHSEPANLANYGITYTGTPNDFDTITVVYSTGGGFAWNQVDVQPSGVTYTAGNGINIDVSNEISVTYPVLVNSDTTSQQNCIGIVKTTTAATGTNANGSVIIGHAAYSNGPGGISLGGQAKVNNNNGIAIGYTARTDGLSSIAIGAHSFANANGAIQIVAGWNASGTNADADTLKVANRNGNFEIMSADGTMPTARLTKVNTTVTLAAADWSSNTQTVNVTGMTATGVVLVSPDSSDQVDYTSAGILCTAQAAGTLTFTCSSVPANDIDVVVVML